MKRILLVIMLIAGVVLVSKQNTLYGQCLNDDHYFENQEKNDPEAYASMQEALVAWKVNKNQPLTAKKRAVYKIPVVVHVVHEYGAENISKLQIDDQIRILNEDFRRMNADASNTRAVFQSVAADAEIEFVLATKDPTGNCTQGIVRVYSPLTNNARDNVKSVSYWPSDRYLNIWIVKSIKNSGDDPGVITLGYAQFPWDRNQKPTTDGIVVRADYFGSIGTASGNNNGGRTATHEIGHWLGLFHTFQGGCNPPVQWGEQIDDTPPVKEPSFNCPIGANTCTNDNPDLPDQVENYMDYANGTCQNMFTLEQKSFMHNVINSYRSLLISASNATFTGINSSPVSCAPKADLSNEVLVVCQGNSLQFTDISYNGTIGSRTWTFEGGSPNNSNLANPTVTYNQPGIYKVTLQVSNANGSSSITRDSIVVVYAAVSPHGAPQLESFESQSFPPSEWTTKASNGVKWELANTGSHGSSSARVQINTSTIKGTTVQLRTKAIDMMAVSDPVLTFDLAYARLQVGTIDRFRVYTSIDCGITWTLIYQRAGVQMETGVLGTTNFVPNSSQWQKHTVSLNNYVGKRNLLLRFDVVTDLGGNIYFDNMNIGSISSVNGAENMDAFSLYPNPASKITRVSFTSKEAGELGISVIDVSGKQVLVYPSRTIEAGRQETELNVEGLASGVYFVVTELNGQKTTRKLLIGN